MQFNLQVNDQVHTADVEPDTPLLWVLRDTLALTGTKFGCGIAQCGACAVHLNGQAIRSCVYPIAAIGTQKVTTIEGLSTDRSHPLQQAWLDEQVPQCGYCQSGMIMTAAALLQRHPNPTDQDIDREITNICRCGTYSRVRRAIHKAANRFANS